ncbi:MAG: energy transducer TonB [Nitrospira defluvii]|nr:energy transducer TonB [Nitrospira defluvii]
MASIASQVTALTPSTATTPVTRKPDYGWLADTLLHRIETLKQYPASARLNHLEGRVIVRIVIEEDGRIASVALAKSSGHDVLDQAALETLRQASPIALSQPLAKSPVTIQIPLSYRLDR